MHKISEIGKVKLNYTRYSGSDLYTDGDIENEILAAVMNHAPADYPEIIEKSRDWSYLYHLSHLRHNIVEWLPIDKSHKVLEIGSGCGAITGMLAEKAGEVVCVDLSETRSKINAHRHKEYDNITIHIGNFADIEPDLPNDFDFILFIGVFEYCCVYIEAADPYVEMLRIVKQHLKPDGHLAIAIENRFGLKYFAGCTEDHLGTYFSGLEDYPDGGSARTFTRPAWEKMLTAAGITDFHFYYPYPDYKFMTTLFSDARLPMKGELYDNTRNFDRHRMELFNERKVFDSIINEDLFPLFSNSYFIYTGKDTETAYLRYSNDRAPEYRVRTSITKDRIVQKTPLTTEALAHTKRMLESYQALLNDFAGQDLTINKCELAADGRSIEFEYVNGKTLAEHLDVCIKKNDLTKFNDLIEKFVKKVVNRPRIAPPAGEGSAHTQLYNHDLILTNILLDEDSHGNWTLIDYEWMQEQEVDSKETIYRALYCYLLEDDSRKVINPDSFYDKWGITATDIENYKKNERKFQDMVAGKRKSAAEMRVEYGMMSVDPKILIEPYIKKDNARHVQVFFDTGAGFSEAESIHLTEAYRNETEVLVDITVPGNVRRLRLDPADMACMVQVHSFKWNGAEAVSGKSIKSNGKKINNNCYLFATTDPNFYLNVNKLASQKKNRLEVQLEVIMLPIAVAGGRGIGQQLLNSYSKI
jgi:SAM-dependent methyltransferase